MDRDYINVCLEGKTDEVKTFLDIRCDPNTTDYDGWSGLHIAASKGFVPLINVLMDNGADIELETPTGQTALHIASEQGKEKSVDCLLQRMGQKQIMELWMECRLFTLLAAKTT